MISIKNSLLNALYPENVACLVCGNEAITNELGVCEDCAAFVIREHEIEGHGAITAFSAGLEYNDKMSTAMQNFKYNGARYLARFFAQFMEIDESWGVDAIIPVPLHKKKLRQRGYNQSELLADAVAARYDIDVLTKALTRVRNTPTQTHLTASERAINMKDAFSADEKAVSGKTILLIDDVRTTGSTLLACANAVKAAGSLKIYALTACAAELK